MKDTEKGNSRNPLLCRTFIRKAKEFLLEYPQIKHEWSIDDDEDHCVLDIPEEDINGFPVTVEVYPNEIMVMAIGAHTHFGLKEYENPDELIAYVLGLVRDLLGPGMRIRERLAGGTPYKWAFEVCQDGRWITEAWIGLFFWNYFGKRSEKTYQNHVLSARDNSLE